MYKYFLLKWGCVISKLIRIVFLLTIGYSIPTLAVTYGPYRINDNTSGNLITLYNATCANIKATAVGHDIMVPANSAAEWTAFTTNKPASVTVNAPVPCTANTWIGAVNSNWSNTGNWSLGHVPTATETAYFDMSCVTNCSSISIDTTANVLGFSVDNTFPNNLTITATAVAITTGTGGWTQALSAKTFTFSGNTATSITTSTGTVTLTSGTFSPSLTANTIGILTINGGTFSAGAAPVSVSGAVAISSGSYTTTSGAQTLGSTVAISGTGLMTIGATSSMTITGLLTVSSTTANAYNSAGTDVFNGGVTLSGTGGMTTGTSMTEKGAVSISAGTWTITSGTNNFNNDGLSTQGVTMTGGTLKPAGVVGFNGTGTGANSSLKMNGGTFAASTFSGTVNFAGAVLLTPSSANVVFHNGNGSATVSITGSLTLNDVAASANTCLYGDGSAGTNTFTGGLIINHNGGTAANNPQFTQGATTLSMGSFSMPDIIASANGALFTSGATGNMTVTGNFTFDCDTHGNSNTFNGTSGNLEIDGSTITLKATSTNCNTGATQFSTSSTDFKLLGGTQTFSTSTSAISSVTIGSLTIGFTGNSQTKTINTKTTISGALTVADSGFTSDVVTFANTNVLTVNGSGSALAFTSTGSLTMNFNSTATPAVTAPSANLTVNSSSGAFSLAGSNGMTIGATTNGALTLNPTGSGTISMSAGLMTIYGNLSSTATATQVTGTSPVTMAGSTAATITMGSSGNLGTTGTFTINKGSTATVVSLNSTANNINGSGQTFVITQGNLQLNPASGTCSGATVCNLATNSITINNGGTLTCGTNGTYSGSITVNAGGAINCSSYGFNWTGGTGANSNWSNTANWQGGVVPGTSNVAIFSNANCSTHCAVTIDTAQSVGGVNMLTGYTGTITQSANLTVGTQGFTQSAGTFTGGAFNLTFNGGFIYSAGTFTPPSGTTTFSATTAQSLTFPGTTFTGPVVFNGTNATYTISGTLNVSGALTLGDTGTGTLTSGTISATNASVTLNNNGYTGTTTLTMAGAAAQNLNAGAGTNNLPGLSITNTNSVTFTSGYTYIVTGSYARTGTATVTYTGVTMQFSPSGNVSISPKSTSTESFVNVSIKPTATATLTFSNTMNVTGNFEIGTTSGTCTMTGGTINSTGTGASAVQFTGSLGCTGTTIVQIAGVGPTVSSSVGSTALIPAVTVSASSGTVTFTSGHTFRFDEDYLYTGAATLSATGAIFGFYNANSSSITAGAGVYDTVHFFPSATSTITLSDTMNVSGTFYIGNTSGTCTFTKGAGAGTINFTGASLVLEGTSGTRGCSGTGIIKFAGNAGNTQTITSNGNTKLPTISITAASPNSVVFSTNAIAYSISAAGTFTHSGNSTINFANANNSLTLNSTGTFSGGGSITGTGTLIIAAGTTTFSSAYTGSAASISVTGGSAAFNNTFTTTGTLSLAAGTTAAGANTFTATFGSILITTTGKYTRNGSLAVSPGYVNCKTALIPSNLPYACGGSTTGGIY